MTTMGNTELRCVKWKTEDDTNYKVSTDGKVYRVLKHKPRFRNQNEIHRYMYLNEVWLRELRQNRSSGIRKNRELGYPRVELYGKGVYVHRLVAEAFIDNPHNKLYVNHKDGNISNNCVDNLEWVTASENARHSFDILKRKPSYGGSEEFRKGVQTPKVKELYDKIQHLLETTYLTKQNIADTVGCSYSTVKRVHFTRKVQRLSDYDYRKERSLGVRQKQMLSEAQDTLRDNLGDDIV
jgi:hypothetical protein